MALGKMILATEPTTRRRRRRKKPKVKTQAQLTRAVHSINNRVGKGKVEEKYVSTYINFAMSSTVIATIMRQINVVPQGANQGQRVGARLYGKRIEFRYELINPGAAAVSGFFRVMILYDKKPNGALPSVAGAPSLLPIFDQNPTIAPVQMSTIAFRNETFRSRFSVLYDRTHVLGTNGNAVTPDLSGGNLPVTVHAQKVFKCTKPTKYADVSPNGTINEITDGSYILLAWCQFAPAGSEPQISNSIRFYYTDD